MGPRTPHPNHMETLDEAWGCTDFLALERGHVVESSQGLCLEH